MIDYPAALDRSYEHLRQEELLDAPVHALAGVTERDAQALEASLGIRTIRDFATNKHVLLAQRLLIAARATENEGPTPSRIDDPGKAEVIGRLLRSQEYLSQAQTGLMRLLSQRT